MRRDSKATDTRNTEHCAADSDPEEELTPDIAKRRKTLQTQGVESGGQMEMPWVGAETQPSIL